MSRLAPILAGLLLLLSASPAVAQGEPTPVNVDAPDTPPRIVQIALPADARRSRMLEQLRTTRVTLDLDAVPARDAVNAFQEQLPLPLVARYADDPVGYGIEPARPITLRVQEVPALDALIALTERLSSAAAPCTWQLRRAGFVEIGSKERLSVPAARERRFYDIRDLMFSLDKRPEVMGLDLVQMVCEEIEPGAWDYGQPPEEPDDITAPPTTTWVTAPRATPAQATPTARPERYEPPAYPALIRVWRDHLIVDAPDFIHRQLNGYEPRPRR